MKIDEFLESQGISKKEQRLFSNDKGRFYKLKKALNKINPYKYYNDLWNWLRLIFVLRTWVVYLWSPFKATYLDYDDVMFHACFKVLDRHVELELGKDSGSESYRGYRQHFAGNVHEPAIDLHLWYKNELPKLIKEENIFWRNYVDLREGYISQEDFDTVCKNLSLGFSNTSIEAIKDEKLNQLIAIRNSLWI